MTDSGITVEVLSKHRKDFVQLKEFCKVCATKGYRNNVDFGKLKLNYQAKSGELNKFLVKELNKAYL